MGSGRGGFGQPLVTERKLAGRQGRTIPETFSLYPEDRRLLLAIMERYGCSKSEALRTIVRAHALQQGIQ